MFGTRQDSEVSAPDVDSHSGAPDLSSLREEIQAAGSTDKPRRGRPPGSKRRVGVGSGSEITQEEVDALFTAENWEALASLPFDTRYVMTGWAGFRLEDKERQRIAQTTATTMKILLKIDPKYIALAVWGTLYFGTWAAKEAQFSNVKQQLALKRREAKAEVGKGSPDPSPSTLGHPNAA